MGRITVFTASGDLNSKQVLKELERRSLPYQEIDLSIYPSKVKDLEALVGTCSVPQVFFNTRYVGGVESCIQDLKRWDTNSRFYNSSLERYQVEIAAAADPGNGNLALPDTRNAVPPVAAKCRKAPIDIQMPDGTKAPGISELYVILGTRLPLRRCEYKGVVYKKSFTGLELVRSMTVTFGVPSNVSVLFAEQLSEAGIVCHVDSENFPPCRRSSFRFSDQEIYRLQCNAEPEVLNSFFTWPKRNLSLDPIETLAMVNNLDRLLTVMELSSLDPDDGLLNGKHARELEKFGLFDEAVCELQSLSMGTLLNLSENEMTAFALNLFSVMTRYANIKVGVPTSEEDRIHRLKNIKFKLAGETFSLQDWMDLLLGRSAGSNSKTTDKEFGSSRSTDRDSSNSSVVSTTDETSGANERFLVKKDERVAMALFIGPHYGSKWSAPFSCYTAVNLDRELDAAAKIFCLDNRNVNVHKMEHKLEFLAPVFKGNGIFSTKETRGIAKAILPYLIGKKRLDMCAVIAPSSQPFKTTYLTPHLGEHMVPGHHYKSGTFEKTCISPVSPGKKTLIKGFKVVTNRRQNQ